MIGNFGSVRLVSVWRNGHRVLVAVPRSRGVWLAANARPSFGVARPVGHDSPVGGIGRCDTF
jgi:hypothetical protein